MKRKYVLKGIEIGAILAVTIVVLMVLGRNVKNGRETNSICLM